MRRQPVFKPKNGAGKEVKVFASSQTGEEVSHNIKHSTSRFYLIDEDG
jgi:hypothetical protein